MAKTYNTTSHLMDNNVYIFLHIKLVTSLSTVDLTPNFSESNDIYRYYKWYKLRNVNANSNGVVRIIIQTFYKNSSYTIIQPLAKLSCLQVDLMMY